MNGTNTSQQLSGMAKVRGLTLVQLALGRLEVRHSSTNQVRVEDNKHQVRSGSQVVTIMDWMVPDLCSRCVAMMWDLQGIHEDRSGMCVSSEMGQKSVNLSAASDIDKCKIWLKSGKIMDKAI